MHSVQQGFSLIELVLVVAMVGILAGVATLQFVDMAGQAHKTMVGTTADAFRTAVINVNLAYRVNGYSGPGVNDNVIGYGADDVDVSISGYPTDTGNKNVIGNANQCVAIWLGILQGTATVSRSNQATDTDYKASLGGGNCTYAYQRDTAVARSFIYDPITGTITVTNP